MFEGDAAPDSAHLRQALATDQVRMAPAVLAELFSNPRLPTAVATELAALVPLDVTPGYWQRAGLLRAKIRAAGCKAALGDALIAQSCLDHDLPLLTRDRDFQAFARAGLRLLP